jgi:hypothetical protein
MSNILCRWVALAMLIAVVPALAQSRRTPGAPQDSAVDVPHAEYRSSLREYRRYVEPQAPAAWRDSNETVNRIGGWREYAREASEAPSSNAPAASSPSVRDAAKGHAGHEKK